MFNFKISGFVAGAAFVLSLVIGLLSGVGFLVLLIRAFIFAVAFFALSCFAFWLLAQQEMLGGQDDDLGLSAPGSRVNISLDTPVDGAFPEDDSESVDDIAGKPPSSARAPSTPLDQVENAGYNNKEGDFSTNLQSFDGPIADIDTVEDIGGGTAKGEALPDMDKFAENVTESIVEVDADELRFESPEPRRSPSSGKKLEGGDFNPKELAQAIQTVLKKDGKG